MPLYSGGPSTYTRRHELEVPNSGSLMGSSMAYTTHVIGSPLPTFSFVLPFSWSIEPARVSGFRRKCLWRGGNKHSFTDETLPTAASGPIKKESLRDTCFAVLRRGTDACMHSNDSAAPSPEQTFEFLLHSSVCCPTYTSQQMPQAGGTCQSQ